MATVSLDITSNASEAEKELKGLVANLEKLAETAEDSGDEFVQLAKDISRVCDQKIKLDGFIDLKKQSVELSQELDKSRQRTKELAIELQNTAKPAKKLVNEFERQKKTTKALAEQELKARLELQKMRDTQKEIRIPNIAYVEAKLFYYKQWEKDLHRRVGGMHYNSKYSHTF